jgi:D-aspartate ligase
MSGPSGLAVVRALARSGIRVSAVHYQATAPPMRTRLASIHTVSDWRDEPQHLVPGLLAIASSWGPWRPSDHDCDPPMPRALASVFVCDDGALGPIAAAAEELRAAGLRPAFASARPIETLLDKRTQYAAALESGVAIPWSRWGTAAELGEMAHHCPYPLIVKPALSHIGAQTIGAKAVRCADPTELRDALARTGDIDVIVQEFVRGADEELYTVGLFVGGDCHLAFTGRKLRQHPPALGIARLAEAVRLPERLIDDAVALLRNLGFEGVAQVEFKRDLRDGSYKLMEANLRPWTWMGLATACDVNLPLAAHRWATCGESPSHSSGAVEEKMPPSQPGVSVPRRWIWLAAEMQHALGDLRHAGLPQVGLWHGICAEAYFSRHDPEPFLHAAAVNSVRKLGLKLGRTGADPQRHRHDSLRRALMAPSVPLTALTMWVLWRRGLGAAACIGRPRIGLPHPGPLLVLAPHPDDETIMGGATAAALAACGEQVCIVVATAGEATEHPPEGGGDIAQRRVVELHAAAAALGVQDIECWSFIDGGLPAQRAQLAGGIADLIRARRPAWIVTPFPFDAHPDHVAVALALGDALRSETLGPSAPRILGASVLTPFDPGWVNRVVPSDQGWRCKAAAMCAYGSRGQALFCKPLLLARLHPACWLVPAEPFVELDHASYARVVETMEREGLTKPVVRGHAHPLATPWEVLTGRKIRNRIGDLLSTSRAGSASP